VLYGDESFLEPSWVAIFIGQHVYPKRYDPIIDGMSVETLRRGMAQRRMAIAQAAEALPTHAEFIARHCRAELPAVAQAAAR
jgi:tryptophan halogenase